MAKTVSKSIYENAQAVAIGLGMKASSFNAIAIFKPELLGELVKLSHLTKKIYKGMQEAEKAQEIRTNLSLVRNISPTAQNLRSDYAK